MDLQFLWFYQLFCILVVVLLYGFFTFFGGKVIKISASVVGRRFWYCRGIGRLGCV